MPIAWLGLNGVLSHASQIVMKIFAPKKKRFGTHGCGELQSSCRQFNPPTPTCQCIKLSRDVGELVFNPVQLIRS